MENNMKGNEAFSLEKSNHNMILSIDTLTED